MTIKEFSQKYSLILFWVAVVLIILNLIMCAGSRRFDRYDYRDYRMMRGNERGGYYDNNRQQRPMMYDRYAPQGTFEATGTVDIVPSI